MLGQTEVIGHVCRIPTGLAQRIDDLPDIEPAANDRRRPRPDDVRAEVDERVILDPETFGQKSLSDRIAALPKISGTSVKEIRGCEREAERSCAGCGVARYVLNVSQRMTLLHAVRHAGEFAPAHQLWLASSGATP